MKITFGKSEPFNQGWKGWSDYLDVFVDGQKVGELRAKNRPQKRWMEYSFSVPTCDLGRDIEKHYPYKIDFGLRAAKAAVRAAIAKARGGSK